MENMSIAQPGLAGAQGARAAHPTRSRQTDGVSEWQSCIPFCVAKRKWKTLSMGFSDTGSNPRFRWAPSENLQWFAQIQTEDVWQKQEWRQTAQNPQPTPIHL